MVINLSKTKELVFRNPNPHLILLPPPLDNVERVKFVKLLHVYICDNLNFDKHIDFTLTQCSQRVYLMKLLRDQGLSDQMLFFNLSLFHGCVMLCQQGRLFKRQTN